MSEDETEHLSGKELAKFLRKQAYQRAKERRDSDPQYQEMKERARERRREEYRRQKEKRKAPRMPQETPEIVEPITAVEGKRFGHLVLVEA